MKVKDSRADEALPRGEEAAGEATEQRAGSESGELGHGGVDAERAAGDLILPHRFPGASDWQPPQAQGHETGDEGEPQNDVIEKDDGVQWVVAQPEEAREGVAPVRREGQPEKGGLWGCRRCRSVRWSRPSNSRARCGRSRRRRVSRWRDSRLSVGAPGTRARRPKARRVGRRAAGTSKSQSPNARRAARRYRRRPHRRRRSQDLRRPASPTTMLSPKPSIT